MLIYTNTSCSYSVTEIREGVEDTLGFSRGTIAEAVSRLYEENRIQKTDDGQYRAIESREKLSRFARNMESAKRMFKRHSEYNTDSDDINEELAD